MTNRERQIAFSGAITVLEEMLVGGYVKDEYVESTKKILKHFIANITISDILEGIEKTRGLCDKKGLY